MNIYWDIYIYVSKSTILRRDNGINISRYLTAWFNVGILSRSGGFTINLWQLWHGENEVLRRWSFGYPVLDNIVWKIYGKITGKMIYKSGIFMFCFSGYMERLPFMSKAYVVPEERGAGAFFFGIFGLRHQPWKGWPNFLEKMWHGGQKSWIESQFLILVSSINERIFLWFLCTVSISPFVSWAKICRWKSPWLGMS